MKLPAPINWKANPHAIAMHHFWAGTVYSQRDLPAEDKALQRYAIREWGRLARGHYERATGENYA